MHGEPSFNGGAVCGLFASQISQLHWGEDLINIKRREQEKTKEAACLLMLRRCTLRMQGSPSNKPKQFITSVQNHIRQFD